MTSAVDEIRALLHRHATVSAREERSRRQTLRYLDWLAAPLDETSDPTHVTASAIVIPDRGPLEIVLHRHKRLGIWLQPGGHVDPGESVPEAALREVLEETGLRASHPGDVPELVHIDVHQGPRGHVHLDTRWLVLADRSAAFAPHAGESATVDWFSPGDAMARSDIGIVEAITNVQSRQDS